MISNTYVNKILDAMTGKADAISRPTYVYLGLCVTEPNASTGAVSDEPTAASYARKVVGGSSADTQCFNTASGGVVVNNTEIQFKTAREAWSENDTKYNYWFLSHSETGAAIIWGKVKDVDGNEGILIPINTVPTFYENELKASIDVPLDED